MIEGLEFLPSCTRCSLCAHRKRVVPGEGPAPARLMLIGEGPGETEDISGRPFVGKAGRLLRDTLEAVGINPADTYITNAVRCRPPKNRPPKPAEVVACGDWLRTEIAAVRPELIVALGASAVSALWGTGVKSKVAVPTGEVDKKGREKRRAPTLTELTRRDDLEYDGTPVIVVLHPSAALRMARNMGPFVAGLRRVAERIGAREAVDQTRDYAEWRPDEKALAAVYNNPVAIDTEFHGDDLYCYSFSSGEKHGRVVLAAHPDAKTFLYELLRVSSRVVMHSAKADVPIICKFLGWGLDQFPFGKLDDTAILAYIAGVKPVALKSLAETQLGLRVIRLEEVMEPGGSFDSVDRAQLVAYSAQDADITLRVYHRLIKEIAA